MTRPAINVSFEVFPPKTPAGLAQLGRAASELRAANPSYVSVTYGAGGVQRDGSFAAISTVVATGVTVAAHLTCVGQPAHEVDDVIDHYRSLGVDHVVALRGDPPEGIDAPYQPHPDGYQRTADLVAAVKQHGGLTVSVSAYPERHPQSPSFDHDLDVLAEKIAAGADRAMTQMFFDDEVFLRYLDRVRARGIDVPVVPGIFPIHSIDKVTTFATRCGASMPSRVARRFDNCRDDPAAGHEIAADVAAEQILHLAENGVDQVHVYTMNRAELALAVCERIGMPITPTPPTAPSTTEPSTTEPSETEEAP